MGSNEIKLKQERERWTLERDELNKKNVQLMSKETQYRHELKSKDLQIDKLKDTFRQKMFEKANKQ